MDHFQLSYCKDLHRNERNTKYILTFAVVCSVRKFLTESENTANCLLRSIEELKNPYKFVKTQYTQVKIIEILSRVC